MKTKKGIFLALGLLFLLLLLLSLSMLMYRTSLNSVARLSSIEKMDRLNDVYSSIEKSMKEIFEKTSGTKVNFTEYETGVIISEDIPNNNSYDFNLSFYDFKAFVESNFPEVYVDPTFLTNLPLIIRPENITYTHTDGYGFQRVQVIPEVINFITYEVEIYNGVENISSINWVDFTDGNFLLRVIASDVAGNYYDMEEYVDVTKTVNVHIFFVSGKEVKIKVLPNSGGMLEVENKADEKITSSIKINFNQTREVTEVTLSDRLINVTYPKLDISKVGTVKII